MKKKLIQDIGGEFALIEFIKKNCHGPDSIKSKMNDNAIVKGIGDDTAAFLSSKGMLSLVTTDMMVENTHFSMKWQLPSDIGQTLIESNVSDIVAMGGTPKYAFLSMCLPKDTSMDFMIKFFEGVNESCKRHNVQLLGGDTTHGGLYVFNLTLYGEGLKGKTRFRSKAENYDIICVTGKLGESAAALSHMREVEKEKGKIVWNKRRRELYEKYLRPRSRKTKEGQLIAEYSNSMIDISDGLASEIHHLSKASSLGARLYKSQIPYSQSCFDLALKLKRNPLDFALYGGEDYEILFTIPYYNIPLLKKRFSDFRIIGEMVLEKYGVLLVGDGVEVSIKKGYDHFI